MKNVLSIVDSARYIEQNCFQHQLQIAFERYTRHTTSDITSLNSLREFDVVVSRLKLRTLFHNVDELAKRLLDTPIVVYDQDPWESFRDGATYKGAYDVIASKLNVVTFATTSLWWSNHIISRGLPSTFVKMWILPEYCKSTVPFEKRKYDIAFIGSLHPRRKKLVDELAKYGITVNVIPGSSRYADFLKKLEDIKVFIHNENEPYSVDGIPANIGTGLWVKDIEAAARGCYSIRDYQEGASSYHIDQIESIKLYNSLDDVVKIINNIDPLHTTAAIDFIKDKNCWRETVRLLSETSAHDVKQ